LPAVEVLILSSAEAGLSVDALLLLAGEAKSAIGVTEIVTDVLGITSVKLLVVEVIVSSTVEAELDVNATLLPPEEEEDDDNEDKEEEKEASATGVTEGDADTMEAAVLITFDTEVATTWAVELMLMLVIVEAAVVCLLILS